MHRTYFLLALASASNGWAAKPSEWQHLRQQIKITLHVPDPLPELREKNYGQFSPAPDVAADRVSYSTDYKLRVPALVYHLAGATVVQHPALIIVNGHGGDKSSDYAYRASILYARAGAVVLTYDPIGEYERNSERRSGTNQRDEQLSPDAMALRLTGFQITDVMQAAHYLESRKDVDPKRIAVFSFMSSLACAVDSDLHACVLAGGGDFDSASYKALSFLGDRRTTILALQGKRGTSLTGDGMQQRPVALWLNEKLKFPNWTRKQIEAMSEKDLNGDTIPLVPRADLHALPEAVWAAEKEAYVYETWVQRAQAAENGTAELKAR